VDIALWLLGGWVAVSALASPIIGLLGRVNDGEPGQHGPVVTGARNVTPG